MNQTLGWDKRVRFQGGNVQQRMQHNKIPSYMIAELDLISSCMVPSLAATMA
jgi:hypothetical protein